MSNQCTPPCTELRLMQQDIRNINEKIDKLLVYQEKQETMYAKKWVENVLIGFIGMLVLSALYVIFDKAGLPR